MVRETASLMTEKTGATTGIDPFADPPGILRLLREVHAFRMQNAWTSRRSLRIPGGSANGSMPVVAPVFSVIRLAVSLTIAAPVQRARSYGSRRQDGKLRRKRIEIE